MPKKESQTFMLRGSLPFDQNGVLALPEIPLKPHVESFYEKRGINQDLVFDRCQELFHEFISALCQGDQEKIKRITEPKFGEKIAANLSDIKQFKLSFSNSSEDIEKVKGIVVEDDTDYGALRKNFISDNTESYTIDSLLIKGLSSDREYNHNNFDYFVEVDEENGSKTYTHKFFKGYNHYYSLSSV